MWPFCTQKELALRLLKKNIRTWSLLFLSIFLFNATKSQSRLYLANDDHTDYMWSGDEATYNNAFVTMLDAWMTNNNATNGNAPDFQTKFNCDGTYWLWAYEKTKTAAQFQALINQVKNERIVVPMNPLIITYGCVPAEATLRGMYYAGELQRKYGINFDIAMTMENQVLPLGLASLWSGCGAKYSWHGICNCVTKVPGLDNNREKQIYWYKGLDGDGVLMKWYNFNSDHTLGNYSEARNAATAVTALTNKVNTADYNYNVAAAFGVGGDDLETTTDQLVATAQAATNGSRRVIVSNELDFFRDIETTYGASLPTLTQTYGNEWEYGCASLAKVSSDLKRSLEKLRSAEAMATIVSRTNPSFANTLNDIRKLAWMSLGLYWEHDFGGNGIAVTDDERVAWERRMEQNFTSYVNQLYTLSLTNLANQVNNASGNKRFFVFNALSWSRTDYADIVYSGSAAIHVVDLSTNTEVRSQIINKDGTQYLRVLASNVPSVGYKVFEIVNGSGTAFASAGTIDMGTQKIDNDYFTLVFTNRGVITSLIDKTNGNKQLVNSGSTPDYINNISRNGTFAGSDNSSGSFTVLYNGPVCLAVKITSTAIVNHETLITIFKDIPRVEIDNKITQNFNNDLLYNTFSFNNSSISSPTIWHEENGAVIHAKKVSNGGHYADQQARYDWLTLNHFAAVSSNGNYGVTLSNEDCYFMQTGNSTVETLDENTAKLNVLIGGLVDGFGRYNQGNESVFNQRFAISAYNTYSATNSMKTALEHQNGFSSADVTNSSGILPATNYSFMNVSDPNTLLWALKPAEEGMDARGTIIRLWNLANTSANAGINFTDKVLEAKNATHIETDVSDAAFSDKTITAPINKNQLKTFRAKLLITNGSLPVVLSDFTGIKQNGINKLNWTAQTDTNFSFFDIERSEDGNNYDSIGTVDRSLNSSYNFDDINIDDLKPYYYRLKLVNNDGKFTYSDVILIKAGEHTKDILLYPNPVQHVLKFQLVLDKKARFDVWVTDISGKAILKMPPPLFEAGSNYFTVNTSNLPKGTYTLIVRSDEIKYVRKFVKR